MLDTPIGATFTTALGLLFAAYGLAQLVQAYRPVPLDEWIARVVPGAGAVVLGGLLAWSGYQLGLSTAAATALQVSRRMGAAVTAR